MLAHSHLHSHPPSLQLTLTLHVEHADRRKKNAIFYSYLACFMNTFTLNMEYRVNQAEYLISIRMAASQEYVNTIQHVGS